MHYCRTILFLNNLPNCKTIQVRQGHKHVEVLISCWGASTSNLHNLLTIVHIFMLIAQKIGVSYLCYVPKSGWKSNFRNSFKDFLKISQYQLEIFTRYYSSSPYMGMFSWLNTFWGVFNFEPVYTMIYTQVTYVYFYLIHESIFGIRVHNHVLGNILQ